MTIHVDTDGDGEPEATFPLKWAIIGLSISLTLCGVTRFPIF
jgi:hypothetical protein